VIESLPTRQCSLSQILSKTFTLITKSHLSKKKRKVIHFPINILFGYSHQQLPLGKRIECNWAWNFSFTLQLQIPVFTLFNKLSSRDKPSNFPSQIDIFSQLGSNRKLIIDKQKRYIDNNLCIYYNNKSHRVEAWPLYLSRTTRF